MNVRLSVSFSARFITSLSGIFLYLRRFSRTRSKTTTVSLIEKPMMVRSAATIVRSNCSCSSEKTPTVTITSCSSEITAPTRELPLEAQPDVEHDRQEREDHGEHAGLDQLARDLAADVVDLQVFRSREGRVQRPLHLRHHLGLAGRRSRRYCRSASSTTCPPEPPEASVTATSPSSRLVEHLAVLADVAVLGELGQDQRAAEEVDAVVQPADRQDAPASAARRATRPRARTSSA